MLCYHNYLVEYFTGKIRGDEVALLVKKHIKIIQQHKPTAYNIEQW